MGFQYMLQGTVWNKKVSDVFIEVVKGHTATMAVD